MTAATYRICKQWRFTAKSSTNGINVKGPRRWPKNRCPVMHAKEPLLLKGRDCWCKVKGWSIILLNPGYSTSPQCATKVIFLYMIAKLSSGTKYNKFLLYCLPLLEEYRAHILYILIKNTCKSCKNKQNTYYQYTFSFLDMQLQI